MAGAAAMLGLVIVPRFRECYYGVKMSAGVLFLFCFVLHNALYVIALNILNIPSFRFSLLLSNVLCSKLGTRILIVLTFVDLSCLPSYIIYIFVLFSNFKQINIKGIELKDK